VNSITASNSGIVESATILKLLLVISNSVVIVAASFNGSPSFRIAILTDLFELRMKSTPFKKHKPFAIKSIFKGG